MTVELQRLIDENERMHQERSKVLSGASILQNLYYRMAEPFREAKYALIDAIRNGQELTDKLLLDYQASRLTQAQIWTLSRELFADAAQIEEERKTVYEKMCALEAARK